MVKSGVSLQPEETIGGVRFTLGGRPTSLLGICTEKVQVRVVWLERKFILKSQSKIAYKKILKIY